MSDTKHQGYMLYFIHRLFCCNFSAVMTIVILMLGKQVHDSRTHSD